MILSCVPLCLSFFFMWFVPPGLSVGARYAYYQVATLVFSGFFTAYILPYFSMAPELTEDYDERTVLVSYRFGIVFFWV